MPNTVVVGAQWGDEGKGKIVDILAKNYNIVVRSQGGNNAGHTIKHLEKTYKLQSIPSGVLFNDVCCCIGAGCVLNPESLILEINLLKKENLTPLNLKIDPRVHIIMPWHIALDKAQENFKAKNNIGTTKKGIGPCYCDKFKRDGIRLQELIEPEIFKQKASFFGELNNKILTKVYGKEALNIEQIIKNYAEFAKQIKEFVFDVSEFLNKEYLNKKSILFEGAQGTMLDINYGSYPFVTSSSPTTAGICQGAGFSPNKINSVLGVSKAYTTRVGQGPFPSEIFGETAKLIRKKGAEFGTNTKRERRIGWLDTVVLNHSKKINGFFELAFNKLDILSGIKTLKICRYYKTKQGKLLNSFPCSLKGLEEISPVFEEMPGFDEDISNCKTIEELPTNCKKYILKVEELTGCKVKMLGVGPKRHQNILRDI